MAKTLNFLALDMGAESGRVILGKFNGRTISLSDTYRFDSAPVRIPDGLHTDALHIWGELKKNMAKAVSAAGGRIAGVGVDTWGVDFALLDKQGNLLSNPYQYRDTLTDGVMTKAFRKVPREKIYEQTGLQFMQINTLYQLYALTLRKTSYLSIADRLLMTPDLFNYWLSGNMVNEYSIATTSQCLNPKTGKWATDLIKKLGIPTKIFGKIVAPGTVIGELLPSVAEEIDVDGRVKVIAPGCHDTALAVAAVPAREKNFAFLSCGTWSLMGTELPKPCVTKASLAADFTNEGGVCGTTRFLKNMTGLWILQECRRAWEKEGQHYNYNQLTAMEEKAPALRSLIDTSWEEFARPGKMPEKVRKFCRKTGQKNVPDSVGAIARCALESLALAYRQSLEQLESVLGYRLDTLHIVGGGTQNKLLMQFAANATGRTVVAGPVEATAIGNVLMQAMALGQIKSLSEGREIVRRSFKVATYQPKDVALWDDAYGRLKAMKMR